MAHRLYRKIDWPGNNPPAGNRSWHASARSPCRKPESLCTTHRRMACRERQAKARRPLAAEPQPFSLRHPVDSVDDADHKAPAIVAGRLDPAFQQRVVPRFPDSVDEPRIQCVESSRRMQAAAFKRVSDGPLRQRPQAEIMRSPLRRYSTAEGNRITDGPSPQRAIRKDRRLANEVLGSGNDEPTVFAAHREPTYRSMRTPFTPGSSKHRPMKKPPIAVSSPALGRFAVSPRLPAGPWALSCVPMWLLTWSLKLK
ncbi:protein of unknown function (plasmid) [Cupriavidus taiwanensis]|uniref:Uncharacterized protein n=2 Tax=Cupriavidus TaxID=106589 RepID=A0A375HXN8_9BURK|nr:hypothetical protein CBM2610_P140003 [Cupriavidus taiwanensis]SPD61584.1 protein of unknown function [Cupriavidus taiwanensis]SPD62293.1 protein of unknown function [Cupriavidus neocaledonicus]SPD69414.1 protein of unknown function [Cupriavidus taiwanensis]